MADANLIKGAYAAAGGGQADLAAAKGMTKIGEVIAKPVAEELEERRDYFNEFVEWELGRMPGIDENNIDLRMEQLNEMKAAYMWGDNATRGKIVRDINQLKADQDAIDDAKKKIANDASNADSKGGTSSAWMKSKEGKDFAKQLKNARYYYNEDGQYGCDITLNGTTKFYTPNQLLDFTKQKEFDQTSGNVLTEYVARMQQNPSDFSVDGGGFNYDAARDHVSQNLVGLGTLYSLGNDPISGRVFKDDLNEFLSEKTYDELLGQNFHGLTGEQLKTLDPTKDDDMVTPDDVEIIMNSLMNDPNQTKVYKEVLTDYYTEYLYNQWKVSSRNPNKQNINTGTQTPPPGATTPTGTTTTTPTGTTITPPPVTANPTAIDIKSSINKKRNTTISKLPSIVNVDALPEINDEVANNIYDYRNNKEEKIKPWIYKESTTWGTTNVGGGVKDLAKENRERLNKYGFQLIAKDNDEMYIIAPNGEYKWFEYNFWQATNDQKARADMNAFIKKHLGEKIADIKGDIYNPKQGL